MIVDGQSAFTLIITTPSDILVNVTGVATEPTARSVTALVTMVYIFYILLSCCACFLFVYNKYFTYNKYNVNIWADNKS